MMMKFLKKIAWAKHHNKPIDGHAPGLRGEKLTKYIDAGISTDHECFTYEEGLEKIAKRHESAYSRRECCQKL